jgi:hypothetical protein
MQPHPLALPHSHPHPHPHPTPYATTPTVTMTHNKPIKRGIRPADTPKPAAPDFAALIPVVCPVAAVALSVLELEEELEDDEVGTMTRL